jgi:hypothetical protein
MTGRIPSYEIWIEVLKALFFGVAFIAFILSLSITFSNLVYGPNRFVTDFRPDYGLDALLNALFNFFGFLVTGIFVFSIAALPQLFLLAIPTAYYVSKGLSKDAKRKWWFYLLAGAILGGGPWILSSFLTAKPDQIQFAKLLTDFPITSRATMIGAAAGVALKLRLNHLARSAGENSG